MDNIDKQARELMVKYPNHITISELLAEIPNEKKRRKVFAQMVYLGQCDKNDEIFGS